MPFSYLHTDLGVRGSGAVHLVDANNQLLHPKGVSEQGMLSGLTVVRNTRFEFTNTGSNDQHGAISLGR